jgi:pyrophosphatase PpaX
MKTTCTGTTDHVLAQVSFPPSLRNLPQPLCKLQKYAWSVRQKPEDKGLKINTIVTDMDGTITLFNLDFKEARRRVLQDLEKRNLRTPNMTEQTSIYLMLKRLRGNVDPNTFASIRTKFYAYLQDMEVTAAQDARLYPGAYKTLNQLRELRFKMGIVTNNGRAGTELTLKRLKLNAFFDAVVTRDDCEEMKPDAGPVRKVLGIMQSDPKAAILVGDGLMDIMAAKAAGLPSVAVTTGPFSGEILLQAEPDYILGSINDLPHLLEYLDDRK